MVLLLLTGPHTNTLRLLELIGALYVLNFIIYILSWKATL